MSKKRGFTLIELLLVIGIVSIIAGVVVVAINPSRQVASARNTQRRSHVKVLLDAIQQYRVDGNDLAAAGIDSALRMLGTATANCSMLCGGEGTPDLPASSLGALWHLDESAGAIQDSSGNGKHSVVENGVTYGGIGKVGTALSFDGNDYVDFPSVFPHDGDPKASINELTMMAWFRTATPPAVTGMIVWQGWGGSMVLQMSSAGGVAVWAKQTKSSGTNYNGSWHGQSSGTATFADGAWHHIVGRYHRLENTLKLYVDGSLQGVNTSMNPNEWLSDPPTDHPPILGASSLWTGARQDFFIGDIDDVALYSRALSDAEIAALSASGESTSDACLHLAPVLVSSYLATIPADPRYGSGGKTYYAVKLHSNGRLAVKACGAELSELIEAWQ